MYSWNRSTLDVIIVIAPSDNGVVWNECMKNDQCILVLSDHFVYEW